eukprot:5366449-Lingulodinium_polyedra.AAC.1
MIANTRKHPGRWVVRGERRGLPRGTAEDALVAVVQGCPDEPRPVKHPWRGPDAGERGAPVSR